LRIQKRRKKIWKEPRKRASGEVRQFGLYLFFCTQLVLKHLVEGGNKLWEKVRQKGTERYLGENRKRGETASTPARETKKKL